MSGSIAGVKIAEWNSSGSGGADNLDFGVQAQQRWRGIGGKGCPALGSSGSDGAEGAGFLDAEAAGLSPWQRLVVPGASSVEAHGAADGGPVSQQRGSY